MPNNILQGILKSTTFIKVFCVFYFLNFSLTFFFSHDVISILTLHGYHAIGISNFLSYPVDISRHSRVHAHGIWCGGAALAETDDTHQELLGLALDDRTTRIVLTGITTIARVIVSAHLTRIDGGHALIICLAILIVHHHQIDLLQRSRGGASKVCSAPAKHIHGVVREGVGTARYSKLGL